MNTKVDFKTLKAMDDTSCTNVVTARSIYRLIKKHPSFKDMSIDCWVYNGHYTKFILDDNQFNWYSDDKSKHIVDNSDFITTDELNKLIVCTYRTMCDNINNEADFVDSPEELLALSESKLKDLIAESNE